MPMPTRDALLERHSATVREVFLALRDLVREVMPGATEQLDLPDRVLAFGFGPPGGMRLRDLAIGLIPHTAHVNVQLADGAALPDPAGIVEGSGKRIRHVKCRSLEDVGRPALRALIEPRPRSAGADIGRLGLLVADPPVPGSHVPPRTGGLASSGRSK